ncbi:MAG: SDR family oxidoreductase [Candidatus Omnitrophica bacterium]|nr:SDR family oxidoreductase [Candidatus Omnitrophota bacterium]
MSKFLVAGGAGFIGSHITEHLLDRKHFVRVLDNFCSGKKENIAFSKEYNSKQFELIEGDIRDKKVCDKAAKGMDYVLLLAALRSVPKSFTCPKEYNDVNINGTLNMLEAAVKARIKRFVFSSSSSIYGDQEKFPIKEAAIPKFISPYALTKQAGENYCRIFSEKDGLETVSLRYFNIFGPRQALDDDYAVVIPKFIKCLIKNDNPPIFGDGHQSRDFTYVDNVVQANILAATKPGIKLGVFNVACAEETSVIKLVDILNKILKRNIKPVFLKKRPGDIYRTIADISSISKSLGYIPKIRIEEGLIKTVKHFSDSIKK